MANQDKDPRQEDLKKNTGADKHGPKTGNPAKRHNEGFKDEGKGKDKDK